MKTTSKLIAGPWSENADDWDTVVIDGEPWPGIAKVRVTRSVKVDRKPRKGSTGETQTFNGVNNAEIEISVSVYSSEDYARIQNDLLPSIEPNPETEELVAHDIGHPVCEFRKVSAFTVLGVEGPKPGSDGAWVITIKAVEHRPPKEVVPTDAAGTGSSCAMLLAQRDSWIAKLATTDGSDFGEINQNITKYTDLMIANGCFSEEETSGQPQGPEDDGINPGFFQSKKKKKT